MKNDLTITKTARAAISVCSKLYREYMWELEKYQCFNFMLSDVRQNATRAVSACVRPQRMDLSARANTEKANGVEYFRFGLQLFAFPFANIEWFFLLDFLFSFICTLQHIADGSFIKWLTDWFHIFV